MALAPAVGTTALHRAAQRGNEEEVAALLDKGCDMSARDGESRIPLHHAVIRGHVGVVDLLLARGGPGLLLAKDILGCTPVHLAAVQNQVTLIIRLVEALLRDEAGRTPLHEVARRRCMQDFMGFLHLGWESATFEDDGLCKPLAELSPLWAAVAEVVDLSRPGLPTVQRVLGWHPLHVAAMSGNIELLRRLVQQFNCDLKVKSMNSWTPLHYAAAYNQVAAIEALISLGCEVVVPDAVGSTPIHVAAGEGHLEAIQELVRLGCSSQVVDRDGCTPLYCAAAWNRIEAVRLLEKLNCPSSLRSVEGRTAVHVAAEQGWVELIDVLIRELGNQVDARDNYQFTPLHSAANGGHVAAIQCLASLNHDLNARDYLGRTPLHYAAMHGRVAAMEELLRLGADMGQKDLRGGCTALHLAADSGQCDSVARLVALGAPVDGLSSKGQTPLHLALLKGPASIETICVLVELGADVTGLLAQRPLETPLHIAARCGRADIIERLLKCPQINVTCRTKDGSTALHYGAAFGQTHVLAPLVAAGCPVDSRDNALNTPLHLAAGCGFLDTVSVLVDLGANVNSRDITDCTPLQNAAHGTYSALASVPSTSSAAAAPPALPPAASATGYARLNPPHQPQLTPAQQAAQAAITAGSSVKRDGLVPVRTGLAWAPAGGSSAVDSLLGGSNSLWGSGGFSATLDFGGGSGSGNGSSAGTAAAGSSSSPDLWATWRSLGLTKLLKKAYSQQQRRQAATGAAGASAAQAQLQQTQQTVQAALQQMQAALARSQEVLQQQLMLQLQGPGGAASSRGSGAAADAGLCAPTSDQLLLEAGASGSGGGCSVVADSTEATPLSASSFTSSSSSAASSFPFGSTAATAQLLGGVDGSGLALAAAAAAITKPVVDSSNMDCLARRTDQLSFAAAEQDRTRLIKVVERLVELGADLHLTDNEGRTALHLAAGCGDKAMGLKLIELGTDVNCKDSVGGTAMHHAAMANKKDMMFSLARLGCDWRARADGIDGATASFVLCGQHGKTTRQQKLLDAKLKRMAQEGAAARAAGRNPLAGERDDDQEESTADLEVEQALADAAMAALLEEEETEQESLQRQKSAGGSASKKKKQKAKAKAAKGKADAASAAAAPAAAASSAPATGEAEEEGEEEEEEEVEEASAAPLRQHKAAGSCAAVSGPQDSATKEGKSAVLTASVTGVPSPSPAEEEKARKAKPAAKPAEAAAAVAAPGPSQLQPQQQQPVLAQAAPLAAEPSAGSHSRADSVAESLSVASEHEVPRQQLEEAAESAAKLLATEPQGEEGEAQLEAAMQVLDEAIERAATAGVSAKYGKKVRRKLQLHLNELRGIPPPEGPSAAAAAAAAAQQQEAEECATAAERAAAEAAAAAAAAVARQAQQQQQQAAQHANGHAKLRSAGQAKYSPPTSKVPPKPVPPGFHAPPPQQQPQSQQQQPRAQPSPVKAPYKPLSVAQQRQQAAPAPPAHLHQHQQALPRPAWGQLAPQVPPQRVAGIPAPTVTAPAASATPPPPLSVGLPAQPQYAAAMGAGAATSGGSLFSTASLPPTSASTSLFSSHPAPIPPSAHQQQHMMPPTTAATTSLFAAPQDPVGAAASTTSGSLFAAPPERPALSAPVAQQPAFASLAAFSGSGVGSAAAAAAAAAVPTGSSGGSAGASLASQFADLDIGELQQAGYESFAAGGEVSAAPSVSPGPLLFPSAPPSAASLSGLLQEPLDSGGAELLSRDLLGEIDGVALLPQGPPSAQQQQQPSLLHLPDRAESLFGSAAQTPASGPPTATSAGNSFNAFRSLW